MNSKISETGYWSGDNAHNHHVHSPKLAQFIVDILYGKFSDDNGEVLNPKKRIYDLGCGLGEYLLKLEQEGFSNLVGFEGDIPKNKVYTNIWKQDLTRPIASDEKGHLLFLEVGEHIPQEFEKDVVSNIYNLCKGYLILSWAVPGQAGFGHVNCKTNEEVIELFQKLGFIYLPAISEEARKNVDDFAPWFRQTLMIFYK